MDGGDRVASWEAKLQILGERDTSGVAVPVLSCAKLPTGVEYHAMDSDTEDAFYTEPPRAAWQIVDIVDRDPKEHRKVWYDWYGNMSVSRRHHEKHTIKYGMFHCVSGKLLCKNYLLFLFCF